MERSSRMGAEDKGPREGGAPAGWVEPGVGPVGSEPAAAEQ